MQTYSVVIPGNGTGQRFECNELPKQFVLIRNKPLIYYTINAFVNCSKHLSDYKLNEIVVSCSNEFHDYIRDKVVKPIIEQNKLVIINLVRGGEFRHQSIFNCLKYLAGIYGDNKSEHIVLIHDAVRPLVELDLVRKLIKNALCYGASGPICNLSSTILRTDEDCFLDHALNRDEYKASEMPQSCRLNSILKAYNRANETDIKFGTECLDLIRKYTDCRIKLIPSNANSLFKVTYKKDYFTALGMIRQKYSYRTWLLSGGRSTQELNLIKFESNLKLINLNDLDLNSIEFEKSESIKCDILFVFSNKNLIKSDQLDSISKLTYGHLILIYLQLSEQCSRQLMLNYSQSFLHSNKMTILFCLDINPINSLALYDKIKLICNNQHSMLGQFIQLQRSECH